MGVVLINELAIGLIFMVIGYKAGTNKEKLVQKTKDFFSKKKDS